MDGPRHLLLCLLPLAVLLTGCSSSPSAVRIEHAEPPPTIEHAEAHAIVADQPAVVASTSPTSSGPFRSVARARTNDDPELLAAIQRELGSEVEDYSVVVRRLTDGRGAALNPDREYYAASLFKLALLYEAERQRGAGLLDFDSGLEVTAAAVDEDLGTIDSLGVGIGDTLPVREAVRAMITRSDNTSAVLMLYRLGPGTVDGTLRGLGLTGTSVNTEELPTTAADMALLMEAVVRGTGLNAAARTEMRSLLLAQETRSGIPRSLPAGVHVGNKTGTWPGATHDVAFVEAPAGTYVIAILSDHSWDWDPIARVSRAVYEVLGS
jgi:beta-lactamase class A